MDIEFFKKTNKSVILSKLIKVNLLLVLLILPAAICSHYELSVLFPIILLAIFSIGLILQPWFMLIAIVCFIPVIILIKPSPDALARLITFSLPTLAIASYITSHFTVWAYRYIFHFFRFIKVEAFIVTTLTLKRLCIAAIVYIALFTVAVFGYHRDYFTENHGVPAYVWLEAERIGLSYDKGRLYSHDHTQPLWKVEISKPDIAKFMQELKMQQRPLTSVPEKFYRLPPHWWEPSKDKNVVAYFTGDFPLGGVDPKTVPHKDDEPHIIATWNPSTKILHMWIIEVISYDDD